MPFDAVERYRMCDRQEQWTSMTARSFFIATASAIFMAGFGPAPPQGIPRTSATSTPSAESMTSVDRARTLPCQRFRQTPNGSWTMIGPVQANGTNLENVTFSKGTAEAAVLGQRCPQ
jgi:hypothetical protein